MKAEKNGETEFRIYKDRLVRISVSKRDEEKIQLCLPKEYREEILNLCHSSVTGHVGVIKSKDNLLANCFGLIATKI